MEDLQQQPPSISPFRLLLHRAMSILWQEELEWEQELLDAAIEESINTHQESLFSCDPHRKVKLNETDLLVDSNEECHLCLEDMLVGNKVIVLPCRHFFHSHCIRQLVEHRHIACPLCRQSIPIIEEEEEEVASNS